MPSVQSPGENRTSQQGSNDQTISSGKFQQWKRVPTKTRKSHMDCKWHRTIDWNSRRILRRGHLCLFVAVFLAIPVWPQQKPADLADASLEDLMDIKVTSVSKKEQK